MSIALGAYIVYDRACRDTRRDEHVHLTDLATRIAALATTFHRPALDPSNPRAARAKEVFEQTLSFTSENDSHVSRLYSFSLAPDAGLVAADSMSGDDASLPDAAKRAREHFLTNPQDKRWLDANQNAATGFAIIGSNDERLGVVAVESDVANALVRIASIRQSLWTTCLLGLAIGGATAIVVWQTRTTSARAFRATEEDRRLEEVTFDSLGEIVYRFDVQEGRFRWRANTHELLGCATADMAHTKKEWLARIHPEDQPAYSAAINAAIAHGAPMRIEYRARREDGRFVWLSDRCQAVTMLNDRLFLVGSLVDITQTRNAGETLRVFFEETSIAHMIFEGDVIIDANPATVALFGVKSAATLIEKPVWSLWPRRQQSNAISAEAWSREVLAAMEEGSSHFEWTFTRGDGGTVACEVFLRSTTLEDRPVLLMACIDITPMKQAQAKLIESEHRFRDISDSVGEFVWEVDRTGRYIYASSRVWEIFRIEPAAAIGRHPVHWVPEEDRAEFTRRSASIIGSAQPFKNFEHRVRREDGDILWISASGVPNFDQDGNLIGYRGASLDITKRRLYEQELLLQKNAAEAADVAKSSFLAMMSHEIRTPLNSVLGFADLMLDTNLTSIQRDYMQTIKRSGDSLLVVINDVLDFTKIESGRMEVESRSTNLAKCITQVLDMYKPAADARKLTLSMSIDPSVADNIQTDPARLRQILINLVGNAVKFTTKGSIKVDANLDDSGRHVLLHVTDTGIGIDETQQDRLFKPFSQADSSTTRRFGGTGLGLVISKRLAGLLGGDLRLEKTSRSGSAFVLQIPHESASVPEDPEQDDLSDNAATPVFAGRIPRVLVVDDNALNQRLTTLLLRQLGADVESASSAAEFFRMLETGAEWDMVLMDVQMPEMDGLEATRKLREMESAESRPRLSVIALTANAMVGDRERCLAAGMDGYLSKPLRREALARLLAERFDGSLPV